MARWIATMMLLMLATASAAPRERAPAFVRLHLISSEWVVSRTYSDGTVSGTYHARVRVVERYQGGRLAPELTVRLSGLGLPRPGGEIFALVDGRGYAEWWETTDIGLCIGPTLSEEYFGKP